MKKIIPLLLIILTLWSCKDDSSTYIVNPQRGKLNRYAIENLVGFGEQRDALLAEQDIFLRDFIVWSTDSAWSLEPAERTKLKNLRDAVTKPVGTTLLQKVISLEEISTYMNNIYGGTIGGFVSAAADMKKLGTMSDIYWGLRLDYDGTQFRPDGAGYAVIRFRSNSVDKLTIPYCTELGGTEPHNWPNGGGGFTTSKLSEGGYPEYKTIGYNAPEPGAELFEVTPQGREILRSVYKTDKWTTYEDPGLENAQTKTPQQQTIRNGKFTSTKGDASYIITVCDYQGYQFTVRGLINGFYHLTCEKQYPIANLRVMEKGIYGIEVPENQISNLHEITL